MPVNIAKLSQHDVARMMDYAILNPAGREKDHLEGCANVCQYRFVAFYVLPTWLPLIVRELADFARENAIELGSAVAFPYGTARSGSKLAEAEELIRDGATALDMVANIGWLKDHKYDLYQKECEAFVQMCHAAGIKAKVIIEIGYLNDEDTGAATKMVAAAGADFVKTATGTGPAGRPNFHDVQLILDTLAAEKSPVGLKVSGVVEPRIMNAYAFIRMGALRIGTRGAPQIVDALPDVQRLLYPD